MIDLSKPTVFFYKEQVRAIYKILEREPWCSVQHFEHCIRNISILNSKIKSITKNVKTSRLQNDI